MDFFNMDSAVMRSFVPEITRPYAPSDIVIRPGEPGDVDLILEMHERLSDESLYKRYHAPRRPTREEVARICALNEENGRLLVAVIPGRRSQIVGMAYYVLTGDSADTAFLVEDSFQGMGIGKRLVRALVRQAITQGVHYFDAHVLPSNRSMIHLLLQAGKLVYNRLDFGARDLRVEIES